LPLPTVVLTCPGSATLVSAERQNRQIGTALPLAVMTRIRRQNERLRASLKRTAGHKA
jgi:hypothetical protein